MTNDTQIPQTFEGLQRLFGVAGKKAVVTGGTRGIGRMIARGLLLGGAEVCITARKAETGAEALDELAALGPVEFCSADLSLESECVRLADVVGERYGAVDILVNNAGATWGAALETFPSSGWDKVLDLNLKSPFYLSRAFLPLLEVHATKSDPSRIINVGSIDGMRIPAFHNYSYTASKAGLHQLTRVLAKELGPRGITVNAIAPGPFPSKMMAAILEESGAEIAASSPLGRIGDADDIAGAVLYLTAKSGAWITGVILAVDGGMWTTL